MKASCKKGGNMSDWYEMAFRKAFHCIGNGWIRFIVGVLFAMMLTLRFRPHFWIELLPEHLFCIPLIYDLCWVSLLFSLLGNYCCLDSWLAHGTGMVVAVGPKSIGEMSCKSQGRTNVISQLLVGIEQPTPVDAQRCLVFFDSWCSYRAT